MVKVAVPPAVKRVAVELIVSVIGLRECGLPMWAEIEATTEQLERALKLFGL